MRASSLPKLREAGELRQQATPANRQESCGNPWQSPALRTLDKHTDRRFAPVMRDLTRVDSRLTEVWIAMQFRQRLMGPRLPFNDVEDNSSKARADRRWGLVVPWTERFGDPRLGRPQRRNSS